MALYMDFNGATGDITTKETARQTCQTAPP